VPRSSSCRSPLSLHDALPICLRERRITTPVLMITAMANIGDRVEGLDAGADDYLVRPFAVEELLARVRALGRRAPQLSEPERLRSEEHTSELQSRFDLVCRLL